MKNIIVVESLNEEFKPRYFSTITGMVKIINSDPSIRIEIKYSSIKAKSFPIIYKTIKISKEEVER